MNNGRTEFTILEQLMVIGIILFLLAVVVGNVLHAVKESQERTVHAPAVEYSALRTAYARMYRVPAALRRGATRPRNNRQRSLPRSLG
jgi:type II secretory pathway pseudopilin PulG